MNAAELEQSLAQFTGTTQYTQFHSDAWLTDGALWLADNAHCYWLLDVFYSYLFLLNGDEENFTTLKLTKSGRSAMVAIDDGNDNLIASQLIEYTDFPLEEITLYAVWENAHWVIMLASEY